MSRGIESGVIKQAWDMLFEEKYMLESQLIEIDAAIAALRPVVEGAGSADDDGDGASQDGPCAELSAAEASLLVIRERPDTVLTNADIMARMHSLGWRSSATTRGGLTGMLAGALRQNEERGRIVKMGRGKWTARKHTCVLCKQDILESTRDVTGTVFAQSCPTCGTFEIAAPAVAILDDAVDQGLRTRQQVVTQFSMAHHQQNEKGRTPVITDDDAQFFGFGNGI